MDAAVWKHFLNRIHKLVHEGIEFLGRGTMLPHTDIQRDASGLPSDLSIPKVGLPERWVLASIVPISALIGT